MEHANVWSQPQVLKARRIFNGERLVEPPLLMIEGGSIAAVGSEVPTDLPVHDLGGVTLLPGLVDCHQHLVFDGKGTLEEQVASVSDGELKQRARVAARRALLGGVTTLRDLGDRSYVTLGLRNESELPNILCSGPPLTLVEGHCWFLGGECSDEEALIRAVRQRIQEGCDVVKVMTTGGSMTPATPMHESQFSLEELKIVIREAHAAGLPVASHCHGVQGIRDSITAGVDTIEHCSFLNEAMDPSPDPELLRLLAESGIAISATCGHVPSFVPPAVNAEVMPKIHRVTNAVHELGGQIVLGTDAGIKEAKPHDVAPHAIHDFVAMGMTSVEALKTMTSRGAAAIGMPAKGRLAAGMDADVIAVAGNPIVDPAALADVRQVWLAGEMVGS